MLYQFKTDNFVVFWFLTLHLDHSMIQAFGQGYAYPAAYAIITIKVNGINGPTSTRSKRD